ncbi:MAG: hypothetical protein JXA97_07670 [Anaerolineales bacterium]|nr:hypothetical protein [Anaerolineales bacterium]
MPLDRSILAIDLAHRHYSSMGFAYLAPHAMAVQFVAPQDLDLQGTPDAKYFAFRLEAFSRRNAVSVLLLDGPQGWKSEKTGIEHMRLCERVLNTPGRSGLPGEAKPRTYLPFIEFSIALFQSLRRIHGWRLITSDWVEQPPRRWVVECFPSSAWGTLGLDRLPGKTRVTAADIEAWRCDLELVSGLTIPASPTHDQLQAAVMLPVGLAVAAQLPEQLLLSGLDPIFTPDTVREGWIANPLPPAA